MDWEHSSGGDFLWPIRLSDATSFGLLLGHATSSSYSTVAKRIVLDCITKCLSSSRLENSNIDAHWQVRTAASSFADTEALILALSDTLGNSQAAVATAMHSEVSAYVSSSATTKVMGLERRQLHWVVLAR